MKLDCFLLTTVLALGYAGPSHAQVFFSNLSEPDALSFSGSTGIRLATDFLTGGAALTIDSLTARMANSTSGDLHVSFSIFTNGSDRPDTLVGLFDTPATVPANTLLSGLFTATSSGINLQANTRYWVVARQNEVGSAGLSWRSTTSEATSEGSFSTVPGTPMLISLNEGETYFPNGAGNPIYSLSGAAIPEPQTWLALLVTVGSFGTFRWWTNRKQD